ncbi:MAG TPA: outer membrane protein assembly factor BamD [Candidatus Angelobacter sp.]|nr:outer membrane protein assembly factor BamD [Candidatus Angelobacter sp.]
MQKFAFLIFISFALSAAAADYEHGTNIRNTTLYVLPGSNSEKLAPLDRGRDLVVLERSNMDNNPWIKVLATIVDLDREHVREITGWVVAKNVVTTSTPNADQIIFGEAADSEQQAEQRGGRKGAAQDAMRLYFRMQEFFPNSPLAGEAMWRSADIRWQLEKTEVMSRPSARDLDPDSRNPIDDESMKQLMKKFPHSKWSDLAAYDLIDNKLCGEWKGLAKCPEKESEIYEKYVREHPQSPKAAEALYNAAWRQAALVDIYKINNENDKVANARRKAVALAQQVVSQYPEGDWKPRALDLAYKVEKNVPTYGGSPE